MDKTKVTTDVDRELEEFMKANKDVLYKRISSDIGSRVDEGNKDKRKAIDGKFTKVNSFILFLKYFFSIWQVLECINLMDSLLC
jgi:hypothetical protein